MAEAKRGGPSKFTPERKADLVEAFRAGMSKVDALRVCGVSEPTFDGWRRKGREAEGDEYVAFDHAIQGAIEYAERMREPMDRDELARVVSKQARLGSVQAMKLRREMLNDEKPNGDEDEAGDGLSGIDELAVRRAS